MKTEQLHTNTILFTILLFAVFGTACSDDNGSTLDVSNDANVDAQTDGAIEAGTNQDGGTTDAATTSCAQATVGNWEAELTDVSVWAQSDLASMPFGKTLTFRALFERYSPDPDVGTFDLSEGNDANFGTCRHCLYAFEDGNADTVYYAEAGTLELRSDPYDRRFDMSVTGLRLIESRVGEGRAHTPVEGGGCIEIADFTVNQAFAPAKWTCDVSKYADGSECHCDCGDFDPDCSGTFPNPPPAPVDCGPTQQCSFDPVDGAPSCMDTCNWGARDGCTDAVCVFDNGQGADLCLNATDRIVDVALGESCGSAMGLQMYCNLTQSSEGLFADGYCGPANICRPLCDDASDCTEDGETCRWFGALNQGYGYCGPEPLDG